MKIFYLTSALQKTKHPLSQIDWNLEICKMSDETNFSKNYARLLTYITALK